MPHLVKNAMQRRQNAIIDVANEARIDNVLPVDWRENQLYELIEDCTGYWLSGPERRLALVAYNQGEDVARCCIWYVTS